MAKHIFITGGVVSSLGKGITAASIGQLLKSRGFKVSMQKFDPYLNVDPGTMSPYQHGEVFVTDDGAETDLDLGHYERFVDEPLNKYASVSAGKIYKEVMGKERRGEYDGHTVQVIPHITDAIKDKLIKVAKSSNADIVITEIGGTVGDIESLPFIEAIRQARRDIGYKNTLFIHNTLVPYLKAAGEIKTKPTQHSVKELRSLGIHADMIVLRSEVAIPKEVRDKIALFCDVDDHNIFVARDVDILYEVIINLKNQRIDDYIIEHFKYKNIKAANIDKWTNLIDNINKIEKSLKIGIIGKYISMQDAYLSVSEALKHSGYKYNYNISVKWIDADKIDFESIASKVSDCDGIVIPSGFGQRGSEGIISAISYLRTKNIPVLAIGYGMQLVMIEHFRKDLEITNATSEEFEPEAINKIFSLTTKNSNNTLKNNIKLGLSKVCIKTGSKLFDIYKTNEILERHRNRYEFNKSYLEYLKNSNLIVSAVSYLENEVEAIEYVNHPWFVGVLYHPEFLSRPLKTHSLFNSFILASIEKK